jgi:murein DD-endopeptidase MepM/ murein hydrolase activator NlpD
VKIAVAVAIAWLAASCASSKRTIAPRRTAPPAPENRHVVQPGENLFRIAQRYGVSVEALASANGIDDPTKLKVGQTIVVPRGATSEGAKIETAKIETAKIEPARSEAPPTKDPLVRPPPPPIGSCGDAPRSEEKPSKSGWIWPVDGVVIERNEGIDIAAPRGAPIWAARGGRVLFAGERAGYGQLVIVRHDDEGVSIYANNAKNCVSEGASVEAGDVVGLVGTSGGSASPKVHFEVRKGEKAVNPRILLP